MDGSKTNDEHSATPYGSKGRRPNRSYTGLDAAGRRAYHAQKQRERRARIKEALLLGVPRPTIPAIRDVLADAAAFLLREELPGADIVRAALVDAFDAPMLGSTVTGMTRSGRLPTKRLSRLWTPRVAGGTEEPRL